MQVSPNQIIGGAIFIAVNILLFWFREWLKHRTWNKNGKALKEIKKCINTVSGKVEEIDEKVGQNVVSLTQIGTTVKEQKQQCKSTVTRFDEAMQTQAGQILDLAKRD